MRLSESVTSEIPDLWDSYYFFFSKCLKFNVDFKNAIKILEKAFSFSDNCIWIGSGKLSLILREHSCQRVNKQS